MTSIKILLRKKPSSGGLYPVVLRITKDRKTKLISLGLECVEKDWDKSNTQFKKSHSNYIQRNRVLSKYQDKAFKIIDEYNLDQIDFTLNQFEQKFRGNRDGNTNVKDFWIEKVDDLNKAGRTGNARVYRDTMTSFFKFSKNRQLKFREINLEMLDKYETHLRATGSADGGIAVRMRELRALYNDAMKKGIVQEKYYPFKLYKISKLKGRSIKKALSREEVRKIENLNEIEFPHLVEAKRFFLFSYYARGMNFYDMMKLTWGNIENDRIVYVRSKTKGRFNIKIRKQIQDILDVYKNQLRDTKYVFPILLKDGLSPIQIENRKAKKLKIFNSDLKKIAQVIGIEKPITSYVARHSYATNMKELGQSTDIISESMGHQDVGITSAYLKDFETSIIDDANDRLFEEPRIMYEPSYLIAI